MPAIGPQNFFEPLPAPARQTGIEAAIFASAPTAISKEHAMSRHLSAIAPSARRAACGDHLRVRSTAAGSQRDLIPGLTRSAPARARLTAFRRAILG
jgi:hypothetical protein